MKILSLSGFVPEQICDTVRFTGYLGGRSISHYCGYAADYISQVLNDVSVDGAVFPKSCDSARIIKSYLGNTDKFIFQLPVPARRDEAAVNYFAGEIKAYKEAVEKHYGIEISDITERTEAVNERNREIKKLYENLEDFSYSDYLRRIHKMLTTPLYEQVLSAPKAAKESGKRVYLVGSFLTSDGILDTLEDSGLNVVGDNLPESGRLASAAPCKIDGNIYKNIAESILSARLSPTQNNFGEVLEHDIAEIREKKACGVIFLTQKYCEPYDYLYSVYEKRLRAEGIKSLRISLSNSDDYKKSELAIEAFSDMI